MVNIIKHKSLLDACVPEHDGYSVGDWVLYPFNHGLYKLVSIDTSSPDNPRYVLARYNPKRDWSLILLSGMHCRKSRTD